MLKPNKKYSYHLDDEYQKSREAKLSPWKFINSNYIITTHFVERMRQRRITITSVVNCLRFGKKYYVAKDDCLVTKHVYDNRGVVEKNGKLITTMFFGKNENDVHSFIKENDNFVFETE